MCEDTDVNEDSAKCLEVYPTDPLMWCEQCVKEVEATNVPAE
jgi:hypothetical protein